MSEIQSAVQLDVSDSLRLYKTPISLSQSVVSRSTVRFQSTTGGDYTPSANRSITVRLSSQDYLDAQSAFFVFCFKPDHVGVIPQDCVLSLFSDARLIAGGRVLESLQSVSEIMPTIWYGSTPESAMNGALGGMANCYKYSSDKCGYVQQGTGSGLADQIGSSLKAVVAGSSSAIPGFDGLVNYVPKSDGTVSEFSIPSNSTNLINAYGHTSCPGITKNYWRSTSLNVDSGFLGGANQTDAKWFAFPLSALFGLFKSNVMIPLRVLGVVSVELTLSQNRGTMGILTKTQDAAGTASTTLVQTVATGSAVSAISNGFAPYKITNCYISADVCQPNAAIVEKIDSLVSGSSGVSIVYDTWSNTSQNVQYGTNIQLQVSRSFSHVNDLVCVLRPVDAVNSPYCRQDQTYGGNRIRSYQCSVGSSTFPSLAVDNVQCMLLEVLKSFGWHTGQNGGCVFNMQNYTGHTGICNATTAFTGCLENLSVIRAQGINALWQASATHTTPNSNFLIAQSFAKLLGEGQHNMLSGISTRLSGSIMTLNLQLYPFSGANSNTDRTSSLDASHVDCILGSSPLNVVIGVHSEQLLRIADSSVMVSD
jgi:hypothetical protein